MRDEHFPIAFVACFVVLLALGGSTSWAFAFPVLAVVALAISLEKRDNR